MSLPFSPPLGSSDLNLFFQFCEENNWYCVKKPKKHTLWAWKKCGQLNYSAILKNKTKIIFLLFWEAERIRILSPNNPTQSHAFMKKIQKHQTFWNINGGFTEKGLCRMGFSSNVSSALGSWSATKICPKRASKKQLQQ